MYLSYYKLDKKPFQISTDPDFLWLGEKHREMLSLLKYGVLDNKGFLLLTGDVGTGKTTFINAFVNSLGNDVIVARVSDPGLTKLGFLQYIAEMFRMETAFESKNEFLLLFTKFLNQAYIDQKKVVLIIDEAQHVTDKILEEIRLLSNIEKQETKLLNIFLVGQNEFNDTLEKYKNRALRQRITIHYTLEPFEPDETRSCIEYRLQIAGSTKKIFSNEAIEAIHTISEGFPRLITIICDHALLLGYFQEVSEISDEIVWTCANKLHLAHIPNSIQTSSNDWLQEADSPSSVDTSVAEAINDSAPVEKPKTGTRRWIIGVPLFFIILVAVFFPLQDSGVTSSPNNPLFQKDITVSSVPSLAETPPVTLVDPVVPVTPSSGNTIEDATEIVIETLPANEQISTPPHKSKNILSVNYSKSEVMEATEPPNIRMLAETEVEQEKQSPPLPVETMVATEKVPPTYQQESERAPSMIEQQPVLQQQTQEEVEILDDTESLPPSTAGNPEHITTQPSINEDEEIKVLNDSAKKEQEPVPATNDDPGAVIDWLLDSRKN